MSPRFHPCAGARLAALTAFAVLALLCTAARPAAAWTPQTQVAIAREAARLAPPDLARQIERHEKAFEEGVLAPFSDADPARHMKNPDGTGSLDRVLAAEIEAAVAAIKAHRPFEEVVRRLGTVSHYVADLNNPLAVSAADPEEGRYFADYLRYAEKAEPRFPLVFYGLRPGLSERGDASALVFETLRRSRSLYPGIGREYRRIGFASGVGRFDDRSTAFGLASLSFSHAVTDAASLLRHVWLKSGGGDQRRLESAGGPRVLRLPRTPRTR